MKPQLKNLHVLVADDTAVMRDLMRSVLHAIGVGKVETACDGEQAAAMFFAQPADVVFADWQMEPSDGLVLTRRLRAPDSPNRFVPIIMMTAHAEAERVIAARNAGVHEYLVKPISGDGVLTRLAEVINRPREFMQTQTYFGPAPRHAFARATDS
jgi:CheY-like chemotaxis protein